LPGGRDLSNRLRRLERRAVHRCLCSVFGT